MPCDIVFERDLPVTLRDSVVIYTDVFGPAAEGPFPGFIASGADGKRVGNQHLDDRPGRFNVPLSRLSGLQKWEALDPAAWVAGGYVIHQPDRRGSDKSGGADAVNQPVDARPPSGYAPSQVLSAPRRRAGADPLPRCGRNPRAGDRRGCDR